MLRFLAVGGANTVATSAAFYGLAALLPARVAFTVVYVAGLAFVVAATPRYIFGSRSSWARRLLLALWYVATYGVGIAVISILSALSAPRLLLVLGTVAVTAPLSFLGGRLLVGPAARRPGPEVLPRDSRA